MSRFLSSICSYWSRIGGYSNNYNYGRDNEICPASATLVLTGTPEYFLKYIRWNFKALLVGIQNEQETFKEANCNNIWRKQVGVRDLLY